MNKHPLTRAALIALGSISVLGAPQAATILIDNFAINQGPVIAGPARVDGPVLTNSAYWTTRRLSIVDVHGTSGSGVAIEIIGGQLEISNGVSSNAVSAITWSLDTSALGRALANATFFEISIEQVGIEFGSVTISPTVPGSAVRTSGQDGQALALFAGAPGSVPNSFTITFDSSLKADSSWKNFKITSTCRPDGARTGITAGDRDGLDGCAVDTPTTLPLLGLGIFGIAALRRKKSSRSGQ